MSALQVDSSTSIAEILQLCLSHGTTTVARALRKENQDETHLKDEKTKMDEEFESESKNIPQNDSEPPEKGKNENEEEKMFEVPPNTTPGTEKINDFPVFEQPPQEQPKQKKKRITLSAHVRTLCQVSLHLDRNSNVSKETSWNVLWFF